MTDTPEDWVLIEAAKRGCYIGGASNFRHSYKHIKVFRALCDMILKHEQPPVDRKLLCAREAAERGLFGESPVDPCLRAIELYLEGYGK